MFQSALNGLYFQSDNPLALFIVSNNVILHPRPPELHSEDPGRAISCLSYCAKSGLVIPLGVKVIVIPFLDVGTVSNKVFEFS